MFKILRQCYNVNFKGGVSYIDSSDWIKKKKTTVNWKNMDGKSFQYVVTVALNYEEIKWNPEKVSNIKPIINKYNCKEMNYLSKIDDRKSFEKNNSSFALHILYTKEKEICPDYISKINSNSAKQIILLMIPNKEKEGLHYLLLKKLSTLLRETISKHHGNFNCLNCLHSFRTENKLKCH